MEIIEARLCDIDDDFMRMFEDFYNSTVLKTMHPFCPDTFKRFAEGLTRNHCENSVIFIAQKDNKSIGFIGATLAPIPFCKDVLVANELFWYVDPEHRKTNAGLKLLDKVIGWAKYSGANSIYFVAIEDDMTPVVEKIYGKRGFVKTEHGYMRRL